MQYLASRTVVKPVSLGDSVPMRDFRLGILPVLVLVATPGVAWGLGLEAGPPLEPLAIHADALGLPVSGDRPCLAEHAMGGSIASEADVVARSRSQVDPRFLPAGWATGELAVARAGVGANNPLASSMVCGQLPESAVEVPPVERPGVPMAALALLGLGSALALLRVKRKPDAHEQPVASPVPAGEVPVRVSPAGAVLPRLAAPARASAPVANPLLARRLARA